MRASRNAVAFLVTLAFVADATFAFAEDVIVDASSVVRELSPDFHGINYVGFWDPVQGSAASREALSRTAIKVVRFPGGDPGNWYDWQCPYYTDSHVPNCPASPVASSWSSTSPLDVWNYARSFGGTVLFQTNTVGNVPGPPGRGYAANSAENAAAFASHAKEHGMRAVFEIGNEYDIHMTSVHDPSFGAYIEAFNAQASAIHAADSSARVFGPAGTNEYFWWALDSLGMFLAATGDKTGTGAVDGVSLHYYRTEEWDGAIDAAQSWQRSGGPWEFIQTTLSTHDTRALPVYVTEWHVGAPNAAFNASVAGALLMADMVGAFAQSGVAAHQYFTTHGVSTDPNSWGLLYGANEERPADSATPAYYAAVLWGKMGRSVLGLAQTSDPSRAVSSYATRRQDGSIQVLSVNKSATEQTIAVSFSGHDPDGRSVDVYVLSPSDGGDRTSRDADYNGARNPSPAALPGPFVESVSGAVYSRVIPPSSIVLLDFEGQGGGPGAGGSGAGGASPAAGSGAAPSAGGRATGSGGVATGGATAQGTGGVAGTGGAVADGGGARPQANDDGCGCKLSAARASTPSLWLLLSAGAFGRVVSARRRGLACR